MRLSFKNKIEKTGYIISLLSTVTILLWIGLFKFTPTEAKAIEPLIANHFLMSWLYDLFSLQAVSNIIGITEIIIAIGLIASFWNKKIGQLSALLTAGMFLTTLSFIFTTPNTWKLVDGFPTANFFMLKDLAFLGISLIILGKNS